MRSVRLMCLDAWARPCLLPLPLTPLASCLTFDYLLRLISWSGQTWRSMFVYGLYLINIKKEKEENLINCSHVRIALHSEAALIISPHYSCSIFSFLIHCSSLFISIDCCLMFWNATLYEPVSLLSKDDEGKNLRGSVLNKYYFL